MGLCIKEFLAFEQDFLKLIDELQTVTASELRLREALHKEATRAESAEAARDSATRDAAEARASAAAAVTASAATNAALANAQDELTASKMQFELAEKHRAALEDKCSELASEIESLKRELQKQKPFETNYCSLQKHFLELQERMKAAISDSQREASRLESELRRVEKCAAGGAEIRDRARLAAAAHVRERRLAAAEMQHTNHELHVAKSETTKLTTQVAELQSRLAMLKFEETKKNNTSEFNEETLVELRSALEAERVGAARLEKALAAALADNAVLAAKMNEADNSGGIEPERRTVPPPPQPVSRSTSAIDSFLAE